MNWWVEEVIGRFLTGTVLTIATLAALTFWVLLFVFIGHLLGIVS